MDKEISKFIKTIKEIWLTDITPEEAEKILKEHPNIYYEYKTQAGLFRDSMLRKAKK